MDRNLIPWLVATVLTACGIETRHEIINYLFREFWLQQYLPLAVLKPLVVSSSSGLYKLQQYLPLAVLKHT